jgi:hypothetical protein
MPRTRTLLASAVAALVAATAGSLGAAQADSTGPSGATGSTGAPTATVTVNGAGFVTVDQSASTAAFQSAYMTALGSALSDAKAKATLLATQSGATLGAVQTITEQSNDNGGCASPIFAAQGRAKGAPSTAPAPVSHHRKHTKAAVHHAAAALARAADVTNTSCTVEADVTVTYGMS